MRSTNDQRSFGFGDTILDEARGIEVHGRCGGAKGECQCWDSEFNRAESGYLNEVEDSAYTRWHGIPFDFEEWEYGIREAADRADRGCCIVPRILIVWEVLRPRDLPWWVPLAVPFVQLLFRHNLINRSRRAKKDTPAILTIGYYGLEEPDLDEIPF